MAALDDRLSATRPRWRVAPAARCEWREWDGEFIVFASDSGATHHLGPPHGAALITLLDCADGLDRGALRDKLDALLATQADVTPLPASAIEVDAILRDLHAKGLVEPSHG